MGFGRNGDSRLGDGTMADRATYAMVVSDVLAVACGYYHTLILLTDGTVHSAGNNLYGQLGTGTPGPKAKALKIAFP